ncbi:MAG TPA: MBL fold metallo-hydrolase [Candidatus Paceibacterota bacterium]
MIITYQGVQNFKVQFGDTVLAFDPVSKNSKHKASSFGADIALVSLNHPDMNGIEQASRGEKEAFVIQGPGEYEVQGVFIKGLPSVSLYPSTGSGQVGGEEKTNTIYTVNLENINLCFLGALGDAKIPNVTKESIDGVDILFVPIGGNGALDASEAYKFAVSLEPSIIIPMNYSAESLKSFLKEGSAEGLKPLDKLTIKKKDLEGKEGEVIVLDAQ